VWGVGQLAMKLLAQRPLGQADIRYFLDANPLHHGEKWRGAKVLSPEDFHNLRQKYCSAGEWPIVVASTIHQDAIARRIRDELQWNNPLVLLSS